MHAGAIGSGRLLPRLRLVGGSGQHFITFKLHRLPGPLIPHRRVSFCRGKTAPQHHPTPRPQGFTQSLDPVPGTLNSPTLIF
eukprot:760449-Hanusia_phi.AAC.2